MSADVPCQHSELALAPSSHAVQVKYRGQSHEAILEACFLGSVPRKRSPDGKTIPAVARLPPADTFPSPLILPDDELAYDPDYPPQGIQEWRRGVNSIEDGKIDRKVIYVVPPPTFAEDVSFMSQWSEPVAEGPDDGIHVPLPNVTEIIDYLRALYHGMEVKLLESPELQFTTWTEGSKPRRRTKTSVNPKAIALATSDEAIRIRVRKTPHRVYQYSHQLNLLDLLDVAIAILPRDAYCLLMLSDHDQFEDPSDDFCCGRAFGGSRVAVLSSARYHPHLDELQNVERIHAWPASHCYEYGRQLCQDRDGPLKSKVPPPVKRVRNPKEDQDLAPMQAAFNAFVALPAIKQDDGEALHALWLARVCRTAAHELGHCFGMDHCVYYACSMQGTASGSEDARQPPYLCPVDMAKLRNVTGTTERGWCEAMLFYCAQWEGNAGAGMFVAFRAWLDTRVNQLRMSQNADGHLEDGVGRGV